MLPHFSGKNNQDKKSILVLNPMSKMNNVTCFHLEDRSQVDESTKSTL